VALYDFFLSLAVKRLNDKQSFSLKAFKKNPEESYQVLPLLHFIACCDWLCVLVIASFSPINVLPVKSDPHLPSATRFPGASYWLRVFPHKLSETRFPIGYTFSPAWY